MIYNKIRPCQTLQPYIKEFWVLEIDQEDLPYTQHLIPFSWFELYFTFEKSETSQSLNHRTLIESAYTGQFSKAFTIIYNKPVQVIGASFQPWAGNLLYGIPANNFTNAHVKLEELEPYLKVIDQMEAAKTEMEVFDCLQSYLIEKLNNYALDNMAAYIAQSILQSDTNQGVLDDALSNVGYGRRRIEQRFLAASGVSMGTYVKNIRFDKAMDLLGAEKLESLTQTGLSVGYYDQSHFARSFKQRSNINPKSFRKKVMAMNAVERRLFMD